MELLFMFYNYLISDKNLWYLSILFILFINLIESAYVIITFICCTKGIVLIEANNKLFDMYINKTKFI